MAAIWAYLASESSEEVASRFVERIEAAFETVLSFPLASPARDHLSPGLRVTFHGRYAIYYRPIAAAVVIIRILHGARDAAALAKRGGFTD